jgi:hypothetical protein
MSLLKRGSCSVISMHRFFKPPENENTKEKLLENCATNIPKQVQISDRFTNLECREHREYDNSSIQNNCGFLGGNH